MARRIASRWGSSDAGNISIPSGRYPSRSTACIAFSLSSLRSRNVELMNTLYRFSITRLLYHARRGWTGLRSAPPVLLLTS
jgi:hypothetical protein